jgi:hypothetical protein
MLLTTKEFEEYVASHYPDVTDKILDQDHIAGHCPECDRGMGLQVLGVQTAISQSMYGGMADYTMPYITMLRCPVCKRQTIWILYRITRYNTNPLDPKSAFTPQASIYRIAAIPSEGKHDIPELPEKPEALRSAYAEAIRCLGNNCPMAAAAMFRRALQIITRDILGAKVGTLASELDSLVGKPNKLGIALSKSFSKNGYIIREVGNQAAHPDSDTDLLAFTHDDAQNLYEIFLEVVAELFIAPAAAAQATKTLMERRKLTQSPGVSAKN